MAYESLREWLKALERAGELKRVEAEVSPMLEMAELADRAAKSGKGTKLPVGRRCCLRMWRDIRVREC